MREKILSAIETNARIDLHDLAATLGVTEAETANELAAMEQEGIICGYHTVINWDNTSREVVTAMIQVKATPQREMGFDKLAERIYNYPEVDELYLISGDFDFLVIIQGKTMREVSTFVAEKLSTLEPVLSTATHFVLKKYKDHGTVLERKKTDKGC